jgi:hypothetical protein
MLGLTHSDQAMLFGSKQADVVIKMASAIGGVAVNLTSFFSDGLRKVALSQPDLEYCECAMVLTAGGLLT